MGRPTTLSAANLGERVSVLYAISGDPDHPFSEVTGVLLRVTDAGEAGARYAILRRNGEVVEVTEQSVVKLKLLPPGTGPARVPTSWQEGSQ